jgi:hypothetical protein
MEHEQDLHEAKRPESIEEHQPKYKEGKWRTYTLNELGMYVHLLIKRALHRADKIKARKDVTDAQNYLNMMQSQIDLVRKQVS